MPKPQKIERLHKGMILSVSIFLKVVLVMLSLSSLLCGTLNPFEFFVCSEIVAIAFGTGAFAALGLFVAVLVSRIKAFDEIFIKLMRTDLIVTSMFFALLIALEAEASTKILIWLVAAWFPAMALAPLNRSNTLLKKVSEYSGLFILGSAVALHFIPIFLNLQPGLSYAAIVGTLFGIFGAGRAGK